MSALPKTADTMLGFMLDEIKYLTEDLGVVTVQLDIRELRPKMVTKDDGVLVHYQSRTNV